MGNTAYRMARIGHPHGRGHLSCVEMVTLPPTEQGGQVLRELNLLRLYSVLI